MRNRIWAIGTGVLVAIILLAGWIFGIGPQLSLVASTNAKRASVEAQNSQSQAQLIRLRKEYLNIDSLQVQLDGLKTSVPTAAAMPTFVSELNYLASINQVTVKSFSVSEARPYSPAAPTIAGSSGKAPSPNITNPKITTTNFVLIPVQFSVSGDYAQVLNFVHDIQNGQRLFLVSTFSSAGATDTKAALAKNTDIQKVDSTIGGFVYVIVGK
jgi:Tfp pilus assembly protein PilO